MTEVYVRWDELGRGQTILCPRDGIAERVISTQMWRDGRITVRTSRHDHFRPREELVRACR